MKEADRARARRIVERIRSRRTIEGPYSVFGRLKPEADDAMAQSIAATYPCSTLDEEDLRRCALLFLARNPGAGRTHQETTALVNMRHMNEQMKVVVRDVNKELLKKLNATERLFFANTGTLPARYVVKGAADE